MPAWFILAAVNHIGLLEVAGFAVAMHEITQRAAAGLDGAGQHFADFFGQPAVFAVAHRVGGAGGMDAGVKQRLVGVDIADAHHHMIVHQHQLDRAAAALSCSDQGVAVKTVGQRFRPQCLQQGVVLDGADMPQHRAETARIAVAQHIGPQQQIDVIMSFRRGVGRQETQVAGHAQVDDQGAGIGAQQQVFGAAIDRTYRQAAQGGVQLRRYRPAQAGVADHGAAKLGVQQMGQNPAAGGFDFWQFWHG